MSNRKLIKVFAFDETKRNAIKLGSGVRLDPADGYIKLVGPAYSTANDLYFKTWLTKPQAARAWFAFQTETDEPPGTSVKYRLSIDGVAQLYWSGTAWVAATAGQWNTEDEVSTNIPSLSVKQRAIQVIANLKTNSESKTPLLKRIKIGYDADIDFDDDLIGRSLLPALRALRASSSHTVELTAVTTTFDMKLLRTPYNFRAVTAVYNESSDPSLSNNLYQSFNANTSLLTLSSSVPAGAKLQIRFDYKPECALATSEDYIEFAKIPAVVIENISENKTWEVTKDEFVIVSRTTGVAWELVGGQQRDLDLDISWTCNKLYDISRLGTQLENFFKNGVLKSVGMDEEYSLQLVSSRSFSPGANQNDTQQARLTARIRAALFYTRDAKQMFVVKRLVASGGNFNMTVE